MVAGRLISSLLILVSVAIIVMAYNIDEQSVFDPSSASFFPALVGVIMLICAILIAKRGSESSSPATEAAIKKHKQAEETDEEMEDLYEKEDITQKQVNIRLLVFTGIVILFAVLMNYFNFMFLSFVFLFGAMLLLNRQRIIRSFIISAILSVGFYYIFVHVFHVVFPS
ncbi:tripartite tricarboxylate transporter TctB family protein [Brevibacillus sp. TJ4]|uniref:tripartite tricarboxylate transporter TctB family protein n=1 Tax=Brevibacillus sp. TJ4 TaxID=3234853 RepID=UPI0037D69BA8